MDKMISLGEQYVLQKLILNPHLWRVIGMDKCNRCGCQGPILVYLKYGDYYAKCCELHLGGKQ